MAMKVLGWSMVVLLLLLITAAVCRAPLYRWAFAYRAIGTRTSYQAKDTTLTHFIESKADQELTDSLSEIISLSLAATREKLDFSAAKSDNDPNLLIHSHRANCIGYAAFFTTTCNHLLAHRRLSDQWIARPLVGQLFLFGHNIHKYFSDPFFYDHDFAVVENVRTGQTYAVDPSMSDCLLIDYVTYEK